MASRSPVLPYADGGIPQVWTPPPSGNLTGDLDATNHAIRNVFLNTATLATDLVGAGKSITGLGGLTIPYGTIQDIFIAVRTDGHSGSGSQIDPYDVSTSAKFDAFFISIQAMSNVWVHIKNGVYTRADLSWGIKPKWKITGSGIDVTTIQLDANTVLSGPVNISAFGCGSNDTSGSVVEHLTIDSNYTNLTSGFKAASSFNGVALQGDNCRISNVRAINQYGSFANGAESSGLSILSGPAASCLNALVEDSVVELYLGNYGNAIIITSGLVSIRCAGIIRGNTVRNHNVGATVAANGVQNAIALQSGLIEGNTVEHCTYGVRNEFGSGITIRDNTFYDVGVGLGAQPVTGISDLTIENNRYWIRDSIVGNAAFQLYDGFGGAQSNPNFQTNNFRFYKNSVDVYVSGLGVQTLVGISNAATANRGHVFKDNKFNAAFTFVLGSSAVEYVANRKLDNTPLVSLPDSAVSTNNIFAIKTVATNRTSNVTRTDDPDLVITLLANFTYRIELKGYITDLTGANGLNYALHSTQNVVFNIAGVFSANNTPATQQSFSGSAIGDLFLQNPASPTNHDLNYTGIIQTGVSGTILSLQWAQKITSGTPTQVFGTSYLSATLIK